MKAVAEINDGKYLAVADRQTPAAELREAMGLPIAPALKATEKEGLDRA